MAAKSDGFSEAEKAAMKQRAKELKAEARAGDKRAKGEQVLLEGIAEMPDVDRVLAEKVHAIVTTTAPQLFPKTWYGMPAYANDAGKVVCFFQASVKFEARYSTLGFNDAANLDDGSMWPTTFAVKKITKAIEADIRALVERAVS